MENSVQIQSSPIGSSMINNASLVFGPTALSQITFPNGAYNYKDKYIFYGLFQNSWISDTNGIVRFNDIYNLQDFTVTNFSPYVPSYVSTVNSLGVDGKLYCPIGPYDLGSKRLSIFEVDIQSMVSNQVLDVTTSQANYVYWFDLTGDGTFAYICDNGPISRIYKYQISNWSLIGTYVNSTNGRMSSISLIDGFIYALSYQLTPTNSGVAAFNYIQKINASTLTLVQEVRFGQGVSSTNFPFSSVPSQKSGEENKKNFIKIGNYLYIGYGRNPVAASAFSFYRFNINNLADWQGFFINGFTTGLQTFLFNLGDQLFIYNNSNFRVGQYDTQTGNFYTLGTLPNSPVVSSTSISVVASSDLRNIYTGAFGNASGGRYTKQRYS